LYFPIFTSSVFVTGKAAWRPGIVSDIGTIEIESVHIVLVVRFRKKCSDVIDVRCGSFFIAGYHLDFYRKTIKEKSLPVFILSYYSLQYNLCLFTAQFHLQDIVARYCKPGY